MLAEQRQGSMKEARLHAVLYAVNWKSKSSPPDAMKIYARLEPNDPRSEPYIMTDGKLEAAYQRHYDDYEERDARLSKMFGREIKTEVPEKYRREKE